MGFSCLTPAAMPGGVLLFHCLSNSTIGAVWFHGRVRDGIGWVTDAMTTKLWGQRVEYLETVHIRPLVMGTHQSITLIGPLASSSS